MSKFEDKKSLGIVLWMLIVLSVISLIDFLVWISGTGTLGTGFASIFFMPFIAVVSFIYLLTISKNKSQNKTKTNILYIQLSLFTLLSVIILLGIFGLLPNFLY